MDQTDLRQFIRVYDDVLQPVECQELIDKFESERDLQDVELSTVGGPGHFRQFNMAQSEGWRSWSRVLQGRFMEMARRYHTEVGQPLFPKRPGFEAIRMKRYMPDGRDRFPLHVDATDLASSRRFLILFLYLNDVEEGGETGFPQWGGKVAPKAGRLLLFPPFWLYPHTGEPPRSGPKYIVGTYLHYT